MLRGPPALAVPLPSRAIAPAVNATSADRIPLMQFPLEPNLGQYLGARGPASLATPVPTDDPMECAAWRNSFERPTHRLRRREDRARQRQNCAMYQYDKGPKGRRVPCSVRATSSIRVRAMSWWRAHSPLAGSGFSAGNGACRSRDSRNKPDLHKRVTSRAKCPACGTAAPAKGCTVLSERQLRTCSSGRSARCACWGPAMLARGQPCRPAR